MDFGTLLPCSPARVPHHGSQFLRKNTLPKGLAGQKASADSRPKGNRKRKASQRKGQEAEKVSGRRAGTSTARRRASAKPPGQRRTHGCRRTDRKTPTAFLTASPSNTSRALRTKLPPVGPLHRWTSGTRDTQTRTPRAVPSQQPKKRTGPSRLPSSSESPFVAAQVDTHHLTGYLARYLWTSQGLNPCHGTGTSLSTLPRKHEVFFPATFLGGTHPFHQSRNRKWTASAGGKLTGRDSSPG